MGFDAFTNDSNGQSAYGNRSSALIRQHGFSECSFFSATAGALSGTTSGVFTDLSGVSGSTVIIYGWQGAFEPAAGGAKDHCILNLVDEDEKVIGTLHTSTEDNGLTLLIVPIKVKEGSPVNYRVLDPPGTSGDIVYFNVFYTRLS
jgi:hypothetical protein